MPVTHETRDGGPLNWLGRLALRMFALSIYETAHAVGSVLPEPQAHIGFDEIYQA